MTELEEGRIAPPPWMSEAATTTVLRAFSAAGVEARFVGGAVRDALLGQPAAGSGAEADIDIATPASPERVIDLLAKSGIKVVLTGLAHGTVTAVVPPRHFEITTLRRDVETFGRRARVAFDADWAADAARRDFTINAIFLAPDGTIDDPVGGLADLRARRVRFVGDPATRIVRGCAEAVALLPLRGPLRGRHPAIRRRAPPAARRPICCRRCRPSASRRSSSSCSRRRIRSRRCG